MSGKVTTQTAAEPLSSSKHPTSIGSFEIPSDAMEVPVGSGKIAFEVGAEGGIDLLNDDNDVDRESVYGKKPQNDAPTNLRPPLSFEPGKAFLKYSALARGKANGDASFPYLKLSGGAEASIVLADYHVHPANHVLMAAVALDRPRFATRVSDVLNLAVGEALTIQARIALKTSVEMNWSDVFSTNLAALASMVPIASLITVKLAPSATVTGKVGVEDNFAVTFLRRNAGRINVLFQRAQAREGTAAARIGVELGTTEESTRSIFEAALGNKDLARTLFEALGTGGFDAATLQLAKTVLAAFDVEIPASEAELTKTLDGLIRKAIEVASKKLSAGFAYEYSRVADNATLFEVEVTDERLRTQVHPYALSARLDEVLRHVTNEELLKYFRQEKVKTVSGWGFSLSVGDKHLLKSSEKPSIECVAQYTSPDKANGARKFAYGQPVPYYEGKLGRWTNGYTVDLNATMSSFLTRPTAADFEYGLHLASWTGGGEGAQDTGEVVDAATVWEVFGSNHAGEALERILAAPGRIAARVELKVPHGALVRLLPEMAKAQHERFATALAAATPWVHSMPRLRRDRELRQRVYSELWKAYLDASGVDWSEDKARREATHRVRTLHIGEINSAEWNFESSGGSGSFADVLSKNARSGSSWLTGIYEDWKQVTSAATRIFSAIANKMEVPLDFQNYLLAREFTRFQTAFGNSFLLRAVGAWLVELARSVDLEDRIERTLVVTVKGDDNKETKLVFGENR